MEKLKYYWKHLLSFLRVRPFVGGMEISDLVVRFVYFDGVSWRLTGVRLSPGVMEMGKIKNYDQFVAALKTLKSKSLPKEMKAKITTIVSLSSVNIYSQVFSLPVIEGENLDKAIALNIQMVSPIDVAQAYSGWQTVGKDPGSVRLEILSAFVDRATVDEINRALLEAGFLMIVIEPRALSLSRVLKEIGSGFDPERSYIMMDIDNSGLDFLVVRRGQLYFEYFNPWRDIVDEKGQIPLASFGAAVIRSLHQVLNFYSQHWPEPISEIVLAATGLYDEAEKVIKDNFSFPVHALTLTTGTEISNEWAVALGCGLRGQRPRRKDQEMSLLGIGAEEGFRREQILDLARFWRVLLPAALSILLLGFFLSDLFLTRTRNSLESESPFTLGGEQTAESQELTSAATDFNTTVALVKAAQGFSVSEGDMWNSVYSLMAVNGITVNRLTFSSAGSPITLSGSARISDDVTNFKKALEADRKFKDVTLPLSQVKVEPDGVTFLMTFLYTP